MTAIRNFPADVELIATDWRGVTISEEAWEVQGNPGDAGGESAGYFVTLGSVDGYAKPSKIHDEKFRCGNEKIASDLAYELGLPIPPVVLWERPNPPASVEPHVAISIVPFKPPHKWAVVEQVPHILDWITAAMTEVASAMMVFDTWLNNRDRVNAGNLIVNYDSQWQHEEDPPGDGPPDTKKNDEQMAVEAVRWAYIDYAFSMSEVWTGGDYQAISPAPKYPSQANVDIANADVTVSAIEALNEETISSLVERIPNEYLAQARKDMTINGLLCRQVRLRDCIMQTLGANK